MCPAASELPVITRHHQAEPQVTRSPHQSRRLTAACPRLAALGHQITSSVSVFSVSDGLSVQGLISRQSGPSRWSCCAEVAAEASSWPRSRRSQMGGRSALAVSCVSSPLSSAGDRLGQRAPPSSGTVTRDVIVPVRAACRAADGPDFSSELQAHESGRSACETIFHPCP